MSNRGRLKSGRCEILQRRALFKSVQESFAKKYANVSNSSMMSYMQASSNVDDNTNQLSQNTSTELHRAMAHAILACM